MSEDTDNGGTTDEDYRWKWLATVFTFFYGLGFPTWVFFRPPLPVVQSVDGALMGLMTLVWLGCVVYIIGPETIKAAKDLRP